MCSPAQFRQQSAELYAVIDEILADSLPAVSAFYSVACVMSKCQRAGWIQWMFVFETFFVQTPQHSRIATPIPGLQAKVATQLYSLIIVMLEGLFIMRVIKD